MFQPALDVLRAHLPAGPGVGVQQQRRERLLLVRGACEEALHHLQHFSLGTAAARRGPVPGDAAPLRHGNAQHRMLRAVIAGGVEAPWGGTAGGVLQPAQQDGVFGMHGPSVPDRAPASYGSARGGRAAIERSLVACSPHPAVSASPQCLGTAPVCLPAQ